MSVNVRKYAEYFDVDENYFPCIDESAINSGASWETTYPHETFIDLLTKTEKMLGGKTNRSLWIHGAYGTGKSQCAYALKKLLEVPESEVLAYWDRYDPLKAKPDLLKKLLGHKSQGIVAAYRYASGSIETPPQLFFAVQESVKRALDLSKIDYKGENSLKESVIAWLEDSTHKGFIDALLGDKSKKWMSVFTQRSAEDIIDDLKTKREVSSLMENLFDLAAEEGITALSFSADSLKKWIADIIEHNHIKIVLIWDEFSDFFRQNRASLGEFQKIVAFCQAMPFYFVIVTHPLSSLSDIYGSGDKTNPWTVVQQRFEKVEISLPDNIAFDLIGHAFNVKAPARSEWEQMTLALNARVSDVAREVRKAADIRDEKVTRDILPLHPMAALVLKNIARAFQSNQRSMFDFIKTREDIDAEAFQSFIQNNSPTSARPLLTVDMLWDFFYEKGKDYLSHDIRMILDTFPRQTKLSENERIVLKTILIMQAIDQELGGSMPIMKATDQNLSYAFEGDRRDLEEECRSIAKALVNNQRILIERPIDGGRKVYSTAILSGDSAKIENFKKNIRESSTTEKLVDDAQSIATALNLSPALRLRFTQDIDSGKLPVVTMGRFKTVMDYLKTKDRNWRCYAVLALAKTEQEAREFRLQIRGAMSNPDYKDILVIDALSTPLGLDSFERYIDLSAMSMYYNGNNMQLAKDFSRKAKSVLDTEWKDRITKGQFLVFSGAKPEGEQVEGADRVKEILQGIALERFSYNQDFTKGLTESQLKLTQAKKVAKCGIEQVTNGLILGCEKSVLSKFWKHKGEYWMDETLQNEPIVIMKKHLENVIRPALGIAENAEVKVQGMISIGDIYDQLEYKFGFSPCNLSAFITGFLLKEYSSDSFRYMDEEGQVGEMTPDKLAEMIAGYVGKITPKTTYIVYLTDEEKAFVQLTCTAWNVSHEKCSSPEKAATQVHTRMKELRYPVWCLKDSDTADIYYLIQLYIQLVQSKGNDAHKVAHEIGEIALARPGIAKDLRDLLTTENCEEGMKRFLVAFKGGKLLELAEQIRADDRVMSDIQKLFSVDYSALWDQETGEEEIGKLLVEYEVVKATNGLLNSIPHSSPTESKVKDIAFGQWREHLKYIRFSCESVKAKIPELASFFDFLYRIDKKQEMLPDQVDAFLDEMNSHFAEIKKLIDHSLDLFREIYTPYLAGFTEEECKEIENSITTSLFTLSDFESNKVVKNAAEEYRKNQLRTQLLIYWKEKTDTRNPREWSEQYLTPILSCVKREEYGPAKRAFDTLNRDMVSESEIKWALDFLQGAKFFGGLASAEYRDQCFSERILGDCRFLLPDLDRVRDELRDTGISAYEWHDNPLISEKIWNLALAEYNAGGSDKVVDLIKSMKDTELQQWLIQVVRHAMDLGLKIIKNGGRK